jgi:hypothetical protein
MFQVRDVATCNGILWTAFFTVLAVSSAPAEPPDCPGLPISVDVPSNDLRARACDAAGRGLELLASCGLPLQSPIEIRVFDRANSLHDGCLARYDCSEEIIEVLSPDAITGSTPPAHPMAMIDPAQLFSSLIVHELSHALIEQLQCPVAPCLAEHEYIANVMQMSVLSPTARQVILDARPGPPDPDPAQLNDFFAVRDPLGFAATAWRHFQFPGHGCAFVDKLLSGQESLFIRER